MDFLDIFNVEHPIMQAGMADISRSELASTVSLAGGIGTIGLSPPAQFEVDILDTKARVGVRPYAANLLMPFVTKDHVNICIRNQVPIVTTFFGLPKRIISRLKESGASVMAQVGSLEDAGRAVATGVDALIIQGSEAGGHVIGSDRIAKILPRIRDAFPDVPLVAAGGVYDQQSANAVKTLGADAVSVGTRFLATPESFAHGEYKNRVIAARSTLLTQLFGVGWPDKHRVLPNGATNRWTRNGKISRWLHSLHVASSVLAKSRADRRPMVARQSLNLPIYTPSPLKPGMDSSAADVTALYAGECVTEINELLGAAEVVNLIAGNTRQDTTPKASNQA